MKKKSLYLFALAMGVAFSACKREDDTDTSTPTNEERISGTWYLTDMSASGTLDFGGNSIPFVTTDARIDAGSYFNFVRTPSQTVDYDASAEVDVSAAATSFTIPYQRSGTGTWEFKGSDSLIVNDNLGETRYFILRWTDTQMILRSRQNMTFQGQSAMANVEATIER